MKDYTDSLFEELELAEASLDWNTQEAKMDAWHNGTRGANISSMSDAKLKMNWDICTAHGWTVEADQLKTEGQNRGLGWAQQTTATQQTQAQQPKISIVDVLNSMTFTENDFHSADAQFVIDNVNDNLNIITSALGNYKVSDEDKWKQLIIYTIFAIVLKLDTVIPALLDSLNVNKIPEHKAAFKQLLQKVLADKTITARIQSCIDFVTTNNQTNNQTASTAQATVSQPQNTAQQQADINIAAGPGAKMYRLVTYNKDYNPPARQHLIFRKLDHATNKYHIGIEGQPRQTSWTAEPLFDSIQQAENFARNAINLQTKRNVANFKFSITDKPISRVKWDANAQTYKDLDDLSGCKLVDTILGPAYIQLDCQYCESLNNKNKNNEPLEEKIEKHDNLNPVLFDENNHLKPEIREKLLQIANEFISDVKEDEVAFNLKDVKIVGSNCSYNYNPDSDIDLHIVAETKSLNDPNDLYPIVYSLYKSAWNNKFEPTIKGIPVELYVETEASEPVKESFADVPFDSDVKEGDKIRIVHLADEDNTYDGKEGTVNHIDGIGQLHGTWGGLAVIPGVDEFEVIDEISEELVDDGTGMKSNRSKDMSAEEVAELFGVDPSVIEDQVEKGIEVEHEHTDKDELAARIALDHLSEFPDYYDRLEVMEKEGEEAVEDEKEEELEEAISQNPLVSNGMYSVLNDTWIKEPEITTIPEVNQEEIDAALAPWLVRYNDIVKEPSIEKIDAFMDELYKARQTSIAQEGEYNPMNHAFKSLRAAGHLDELREIKRSLKEKELSLESLNQR